MLVVCEGEKGTSRNLVERKANAEVKIQHQQRGGRLMSPRTEHPDLEALDRRLVYK